MNEGEPAVIWLSGLHIPESYLTALVQATCRKNGWPLDRSTLYTTVTKYRTAEEVTERAHSGCFVSGLYLEGASWDLEAACLRRPKPKVLVEELPILKVIPIEAHRLKLQVGKRQIRWKKTLIFFRKVIDFLLKRSLESFVSAQGRLSLLVSRFKYASPMLTSNDSGLEDM